MTINRFRVALILLAVIAASAAGQPVNADRAAFAARVAAYAERRVVLEGWGYTAALNKTYQEGMRNAFLPAPDQERLALNDAAFTDPSPETIRALVDAYGVDWLFVGKKYEADLEGLSEQTGLIERVFRNENYVVYEVLD